MDSFNHFKEKVHQITKSGFSDFALELFRFQVKHNLIYRSYSEHLRKNPDSVERIEDIPFLPIQFFKNQKVKTGSWEEEKAFKSSGTTKTGRSVHFIQDSKFYDFSARISAENYFGPLTNFEICALLPSYVEHGESSLIDMVNSFMSFSGLESGFYHKNEIGLIEKLNSSQNTNLVFGVSYAFIDLAANVKSADWGRHIFVETGGMKGRKKEITKSELYQILNNAFGTECVHSEYGMTELLSQAYGKDGVLQFPVWCKPLVRDLNDPFSISTNGSGGLNIIDLANIHSCSFIETEDMAKINQNGSFEVLGRLDNSDIRGCSLLI